MESLKQFLVPYVISNILFTLVVLAAWMRPMWARIFLALSFLGAAVYNAVTSLDTPEVYLQYGKVALLPPFRNFIYGFFSENIPTVVLTLAVCQFLVFCGLVLNKGWNRLACIGGVLFGLGLSALGVGSAFPATLFMAVAFFILWRKHEHDFIWNWNQYKAYETKAWKESAGPVKKD